MEEKFTCQGMDWTRREIPGVLVSVRDGTWTGRHILNNGEREFAVETSTVENKGRLGTSLAYIETAKNPGAELERVLAGMGWKIK